MTKHLRPEARPAIWKYLDQTQRRAFKDIVRMLDEAVADLSSTAAKNTPTKDCTAWMSANRSSRTVFLSGGRGTGKTTLLLSLVNATQKGTPLPEMEEKDQDVRECLERIRPSIIWLEPLDMEPMPPAANLLAAILVRIDEAVRCFGGRRGFAEKGEYRSRNLLGGPDYHEALLELQRLQTDSSLAWSGNLPAREGALDPDSFAVEVFRSERARLGLNHRLEQTLSTLAEQAFTCADHAPLFVLPVDDIDLNPLACLDLLKLLRLVSVPRLFTLLLGDVRVAELVLNLKLSSDLGSLVSNVQYPELLALRPETVGAFAGDIAANALRKLLPPSQRVELSPMTLQEGIEFLPLGEKDEGLRLYRLLAKYPVFVPAELRQLFTETSVTSPNAQITLQEFLLHESSDPDANSPSATPQTIAHQQFDLKGLTYTGNYLFETTPRRLADMWLEMRRIGEAIPWNTSQSQLNVLKEPVVVAPSWKEVMDYFARLSRTSLTGEPALSPHTRTIIADHIVPNAKMESGWELGQLPLFVYDRVDYLPVMDLESAIPRKSVRVYVGESKGWSMQMRDTLPKETVTYAESDQAFATGFGTIPPLQDGLNQRLIQRTTQAELVTFHDLWMLGPDGHRRSSPLLPDFSVTGIGWVAAEWSEGHHEALLPWLAPHFQSFWEYDLFLGLWNRLLQIQKLGTSWSQARLLQMYFYNWIGTGTTLVEGKPQLSLPMDDFVALQGLIVPLESLVDRANNSSSRRAELARDWLVRVAVMLMPETGVPLDFISPFSSSTKLRNFWQTQAAQITHLRALRLAELVRKDLDDLAEKLWEFPLAFDPNQNFKPLQELIYKIAGKELKPLWRLRPTVKLGKKRTPQ